MSCSSSRKQILSYAHGGRHLAKLGSNQTLTENKKEISSQSKITKKSEVKIVEAARRMVKSKEDSCSDLVIKTESIMASKTCPICKIFSSASNTTLNAHIDQCLSLDSALQPVRRPRFKPRMKVKFKSIVDIYASAKRCTLEDLDQRNGTKWASISSYTNQVVTDKSEVSKKRKVSSADISSVYVDAKGQKSRILSEFKEKKTSSTPLREQHKDGISEKKCLSHGNNTCLRINRQGKKLTNCKTIVSEQIKEYQRKVSGEGRSTCHRRIYNQRMLAKGSVTSKKINDNALRDQPSGDDLWSGGTSSVLRGTDLPATYSHPLKKQKLHSEVARRNKTLFESKRAQSRVWMNEKEEEALERVHKITLRSKKSLVSIQEDKYSPIKRFFPDSVETSDASPCATSLRKVSPPFVANARRQLSMELKKYQVDFSENGDEEETRKRESEMTQEHDADYVSGYNGETNDTLLRSNPSSGGFSDYNDDDDEEESSEEEEDNNKRASLLAKTDDTCAEFTGKPLLSYGQADSQEDVKLDSGAGQRSLFVEVDTIPIPGPPGSFIPSPRDMWFDENLGNSSIITTQVQSSMDQLDRNSSESPVSNFAAGRRNFPSELSSSFRDNFSSEITVSYSTASTSFCIPSHHGTITEAERISESITLNHQASNLLQRRGVSSSITMNLTKPPDPNHPFELSPYKVQQDLDFQFSTRKGTVPPSPSYSVFRLMGKDLMVMNQGEANIEASQSSLTQTSQFLDPPCAETGSHFNTGLYLRNSLESTHQPQAEASGFRNNFDQVRYFSQ